MITEGKIPGVYEIRIRFPRLKDLWNLSPVPPFMPEKGNNIDNAIEEICTILQINKPQITFFPFIADIPTRGIIVFDDPIGLKEAKTDLSITHLMAGISFPNPDAMYPDTIELSYYNISNGKPYTEKELIYHVAHELRHFWQYKYKKSMYYSKPNARGNEYINDPSEIDADAFAFAYCYSKGYKVLDFPEHVWIEHASDRRSRITKAILLQKQIFPKADPIENFQAAFMFKNK